MKIFLMCLALCAATVSASAQVTDGMTGASTQQQPRAKAKGETVTFRGDTLHTNGRLVKVGRKAPAFTLADKSQTEVTLSQYKGKKVLMYVVPGMDSPACAKSIRRFGNGAKGLTNTVVLCVSTDQPAVQSRFCTTEGLDGVTTLSASGNTAFGKSYGLLITDGDAKDLLARAVIVADAKGMVTYVQLVDDLAGEPDYDAALQALGALE